VLLRLEPQRYISIRFGEALALAELTPSVGSVGDAYDNVLMESIIDLYKAECIDTDIFHAGLQKRGRGRVRQSRLGRLVHPPPAPQLAQLRQLSSNKPPAVLPSNPRCSQHQSGYSQLSMVEHPPYRAC
jgi:transposase InsO family protein